MKAEVDAVLRTGDTVGGVFEVVAHNVPPGLGTYANWDERLDAKLAAAVMSIQAVKAVEIGDGVLAAASLGSDAQDEIGYARGDDRAELLHSKFTRVYPRRQSRRRSGRRHLQRLRHGGSRTSEADLHAAASAGLGGLCQPRSRSRLPTSAPTCVPCRPAAWWAKPWWPWCWPRRRWKNSAAIRCWSFAGTTMGYCEQLRNY